MPLEWSRDQTPEDNQLSNIPYNLRHIARNRQAGTRWKAPVRPATPCSPVKNLWFRNPLERLALFQRPARPFN